jgi:NAD(P)-dependent dehydrogenase (short-subunit alcohol dehydrogenase family)
VDELDGRIAVVTGAASGIGFALAEAFLRAGSRVVLADVEAEALERSHTVLAAEHTSRVHAVAADVSDLGSVQELAASTLQHFGHVDVVCNNAGVSTFDRLEHQSIADWHWVMGVNLWGVVHGVHTFVPIMQRQGTPAHIVNTASIAGVMPGAAFLGPYAVSKAGVISLSETLRQELSDADSPIGVSVLCPGLTETNVLEADRNRPPAPGAQARTAAGEAFRLQVRGGFGGPGSLTAPDVARQVLDAIRADRFWVFSHGGYGPMVEARCREILHAETAR